MSHQHFYNTVHELVLTTCIRTDFLLGSCCPTPLQANSKPAHFSSLGYFVAVFVAQKADILNNNLEEFPEVSVMTKPGILHCKATHDCLLFFSVLYKMWSLSIRLFFFSPEIKPMGFSGHIWPTSIKGNITHHKESWQIPVMSSHTPEKCSTRSDAASSLPDFSQVLHNSTLVC